MNFEYWRISNDYTKCIKNIIDFLIEVVEVGNDNTGDGHAIFLEDGDAYHDGKLKPQPLYLFINGNGIHFVELIYNY